MSKPHIPTDSSRRYVESMTGLGAPQKVMARVIGINVSTLVAHYREELDYGAAKANANVANHLYQLATLKVRDKNGNIVTVKDKDGNDIPIPDHRSTNANMFWMRSRCGWRDQRVEVSGPDGGPIHMVDFAKLSDEQLAALEPVLAALVEQSGLGRGDGADASETEGREGETRH